MKTHQNSFVQRRTVLAIQAALLTMLATSVARADSDPTVEQLKGPENRVEVGVMNTSQDSYKFGEYNGLKDKGLHGILNFDLNGNGGDGSAMRWSIRGNDLGNDSRRVEAEGGQQGTFNLRFLYDELPHKISDSYQTIFRGAGTTSLTLPASYPAIGTRISSTSSSANALANWANIQAPNAVSGTPGGGPGYLIPSLMRDQNIGTDRKKYGGSGSYMVFPGWEIAASMQREEKHGTKLTGYAFSSASTATMLPEPIDFKTDIYSVSLGYKGDKSNVKFAYNYSSFQNEIGGWTAQTPFQTGAVIRNQGMFSSAPENQMHQLNVAGGYRFTPTTRLSYELTKSRMTQDSPFNCQTGAIVGCVSQGAGATAWRLPVSSPDAKVVNDTYFIKLASRPFADLSLNASYKHDKRDNQTPVRTFTVAFADSTGSTSAITNDPINTTKNLLDLSGEYAFARAQAVRLGYQQETIDRTSDGSGYAPSRVQTTANTNDFTLPTHKTKEKTWNLEYRNSVIENLTGRVAISQSDRKAHDFAVPTLAASSTTVDASATALTNAYYRAFRDFFIADRTRDKLRVALNYQVSESLDLGFTADHNHDKYDDAALKEAKSTIFNFDVTYAPTETLSISPYYTYEDRKTTLNGKYITIVGSASGGANQNVILNGTPLTCGNGVGAHAASCVLSNYDWTLSQADRVDTLGLGVKQKGLMSGKLDMAGDVLYIRSKTPVSAGGPGVLVNNGAATPVYTSVSSLSFPDITSKTLQLTLVGNYKVDKAQTVRVSYLFQRLLSSDWQYDAYTNPVAMQAYIGTSMTSPHYTVNAVGVSYIRSF